MGKGARNRRRRVDHGGGTQHRSVGERFSWRTPPPYAVPSNTPESLQMAAMVADTYVMPCRATYLNDPVLADVVEPTLLVADDHGAEAMPVLLFEPTLLLGIQDTQTGTTREMRTEALVSAGFHRMSRSRLLGEPTEGWCVGRAEGRLKLRDPDGAVVIEGDLDPDPAWVARAVSHRHVAVLHGNPLGVRAPAGATARSYTMRERAEQVRHALNGGRLVGGVVEWAGTFTETFKWVLFPPGAFGLPAPVAYIPLWNFRGHGGPKRFGFVPLNDKRVHLPPATGMVANLTDTDIDLINSKEPDRFSSLVAGHRDPDRWSENSYFRQWRDQVAACEGLVVITGERDMPAILGADRELDRQASQALRQSWGAQVPLSDESKANLAGSRPISVESHSAGEMTEDERTYLDSLTTKVRELESFSVFVSNDLTKLIDTAGLKRWLTNLWPVVCQTCRDPLGGKVDVSADGPMPDGMVVLSMHHSACRPSGVTPPEGITMACPTSSYVAGSIGPSDEPSPEDFPAMVINPSCEQLRLVPDGSGGWRNATVEAFDALGFTPGNGTFPPHIHEAEAEILNDTLTVTLTGYIPDTPDYDWQIQAPRHVLDQVQRYHGLAVSILTKALPSRLTADDIAPAFKDGEARIGWVKLVSTI